MSRASNQLKYVVTNVPRHDIGKFSFHADERDAGGRRRFVTCASDLGKNVYSRIWRDAADVGFWIVGKTTAILFTLVRDESFGKSSDEDVSCWYFESYNADASGNHYTCVVYND